MRNLIIIFFSVLAFAAQSQTIKIGLYYDNYVNSFVFTSITGKYELVGDSSTTYSLNVSDVLSISKENDSVIVKSLDKNIGKFKLVILRGVDTDNSFKIKPSEPVLEQRTYSDQLIVYVNMRKLNIVNYVDMEKYIGGVVETEGGSKAHIEYYKSQAIICRTYAYENDEKHGYEGFNMCDGVHCQAYKSKCLKNNEIIQAAFETKGLVAVDTSNTLITAAFHSNCGGITENSSNVWLTSKPYLISVNDSYCTSQRNATWEITIPIEKWVNYLNKFNANATIDNPSFFEFNQYGRNKYYTFKNCKIPLKDIRYDWKLRSTFFSIKVQENNLIFYGKGYGHGVGLCQEGAMKMATIGKSYADILNFYYKNIKIIPIENAKKKLAAGN